MDFTHSLLECLDGEVQHRIDVLAEADERARDVLFYLQKCTAEIRAHQELQEQISRQQQEEDVYVEDLELPYVDEEPLIQSSQNNRSPMRSQEAESKHEDDSGDEGDEVVRTSLEDILAKAKLMRAPKQKQNEKGPMRTGGAPLSKAKSGAVVNVYSSEAKNKMLKSKAESKNSSVSASSNARGAKQSNIVAQKEAKANKQKNEKGEHNANNANNNVKRTAESKTSSSSPSSSRRANDRQAVPQLRSNKPLKPLSTKALTVALREQLDLLMHNRRYCSSHGAADTAEIAIYTASRASRPTRELFTAQAELLSGMCMIFRL